MASIYALFLVMTLYPDVARKAQAELDAVVGTDRLPRMSDRENLPYINAITLEIMRWHTVGPTGKTLLFAHSYIRFSTKMWKLLGLPHRVMEDNIHDGFLIPKGAIVIANIW